MVQGAACSCARAESMRCSIIRCSMQLRPSVLSAAAQGLDSAAGGSCGLAWPSALLACSSARGMQLAAAAAAAAQGSVCMKGPSIGSMLLRHGCALALPWPSYRSWQCVRRTAGYSLHLAQLAASLQVWQQPLRRGAALWQLLAAASVSFSTYSRCLGTGKPQCFWRHTGRGLCTCLCWWRGSRQQTKHRVSPHLSLGHGPAALDIRVYA